MVELQPYLVAGMGCFGVRIRDRGLLCLLAIYLRRKMSYGFAGGSLLFLVFSLMGNSEKEGAFVGLVCDTWWQDSPLALCARLSYQVDFLGSILLQFLFILLGFSILVFLF